MIADIAGNKTLQSQWNETVSYYGDHIFLKFISTDDNVSIFTYNEFDLKVKQAANAFLSLGIKKGDLIALHLTNSPEFLICWLGLSQIGAISVPINVNFQIEEATFILNKCDISCVITNSCKIDIYTSHYEDLNLSTLILTNGVSNNSHVLLLDELLQVEPTEIKEFIHIDSTDTAVILFTSGTTQHPKGVIYTNCNVVYGGLFHCSQIGIRTKDVFLTCMPCYHMDFQEMAVTPVICSGATLVMVEHYSARRFWRQVYEYKADFTDTMSMINRTMLLQPVEPWEKEHQLKAIYFSMGLSLEEKEAFEERFNVRLLNSYGMTETVSAVTCVPLYGDQHWPSVGRPALSYAIKIIDKQGNTLPANTEGEICIHGTPGRSIVSGYYKDKEATKKLIDSEGWLHSGDWGYLDEEGWLYFLERCGNMIKRSGENVSCSEIENVLTGHDLIVDAAVIGINDPIRDQSIKAFVLLKKGATITTNDIISYCESKIASFKVPEYVIFVTDFPRTATGKIKKRELLQAHN